MNQLTVTNQQLVSIIEENGITNVIKPLVKEIFLFSTYVAGTSYIAKEIVDTLKENDKLILRREVDNKFDSQAICLLNQDKEKIGYIPRSDNAIFSRLLDAGKCLSASVKSKTMKNDFSLVEINIFLVDF